MNVLVLGLQWGDEGKGKAIDYLAHDYDVVVRFQGGHNAGHTIHFDGQKHVLHLLPSGVFSPNTVSVIAAAVVVDPLQLIEEIKAGNLEGLFCEKRLVLSESAPLILPFHQKLDNIFEESRYLKIGTTKRGIGPAYEDLTGRRAVFIHDLIDCDRFRKRVKALNDYYNKLIEVFGGEPITMESYIDAYLEAGEYLRPIIDNTTYLLHRFWKEGKNILFEGAQGCLLDISLGTYPYVTASHPTVGGVMIGTGLSHKALQKVIGITKAYTTRVGEGPFPTELTCATGEQLRIRGDEFGSTTGRPRRVGWLDLVALKYAVMINGVDSLFVTKMDILDEQETIRAAVAYEIDGQRVERFPGHIGDLIKLKPIYRDFSGWRRDLSNCRNRAALPDAARSYLDFIENYLEVPIEFISIGSDREQTLR